MCKNNRRKGMKNKINTTDPYLAHPLTLTTQNMDDAFLTQVIGFSSEDVLAKMWVSATLKTERLSLRQLGW